MLCQVAWLWPSLEVAKLIIVLFTVAELRKSMAMITDILPAVYLLGPGQSVSHVFLGRSQRRQICLHQCLYHSIDDLNISEEMEVIRAVASPVDMAS